MPDESVDTPLTLYTALKINCYRLPGFSLLALPSHLIPSAARSLGELHCPLLVEGDAAVGGIFVGAAVEGVVMPGGAGTGREEGAEVEGAAVVVGAVAGTTPHRLS